MVPPDPESGVSEVRYAVVYSPRHSKEKLKPSKRNNKRFSANCVAIKNSEEEAVLDADYLGNYFAAKVLGPSKSSEGQYIFYLVEWL